VQRFFSVRRRAFSLYVIGREGAELRKAIQELESQLRSLVVVEPA
jgi:hypothetical protein